MQYSDIPEIASSASLFDRITGAAVTENVSEAVTWAGSRRWVFAGQPGWADAWESGKAANPPDPDHPDDVYDPGADPAVITDAMILSAVQGMSVPGRIGL